MSGADAVEALPTEARDGNAIASFDLLRTWNDRLRLSRLRTVEEATVQNRDANETASDGREDRTVPDVSQLPLSADTQRGHTRLPDDVPRLTFEPLQEWQGYVTEVGAETFWARLADLTADEEVEGEAAEFAISDLADEDRTLLREGAIFRWVLGYQRSAGGTKRRVSEVVFRRLPAWSALDLRMARRTAAATIEDIVWE